MEFYGKFSFLFCLEIEIKYDFWWRFGEIKVYILCSVWLENRSEKGNYLIKKSKTDDKLQEGGSITHKSQTW